MHRKQWFHQLVRFFKLIIMWTLFILTSVILQYKVCQLYFNISTKYRLIPVWISHEEAALKNHRVQYTSDHNMVSKITYLTWRNHLYCSQSTQCAFLLSQSSYDNCIRVRCVQGRAVIHSKRRWESGNLSLDFRFYLTWHFRWAF